MEDMKDPRDWNEEYLLNDFPVGEFDWLEVKSRGSVDLTLPTVEEHSARATLSKAISALVNRGGGRLILGMKDPKRKIQIDNGGIPLGIKTNTREWLNTIVGNLVEPPLPGFNVYVIQRESETSLIGENQGIFIIDIPKSDKAPHQASDGKYYCRSGSSSNAMSHNQIMEILNKNRNPLIKVDFLIEDRSRLLAAEKKDSADRYHLIISAKNVGNVIANMVRVKVLVPFCLVPRTGSPGLRDNDITEINGIEYLILIKENDGKPIFQDSDIVWSINIVEHFRLIDMKGAYIYWEANADNAEKERGEQLFSDIRKKTPQYHASYWEGYSNGKI